MRSIREVLAADRDPALHAQPNQGKVMACILADRTSAHFNPGNDLRAAHLLPVIPETLQEGLRERRGGGFSPRVPRPRPRRPPLVPGPAAASARFQSPAPLCAGVCADLPPTFSAAIFVRTFCTPLFSSSVRDTLVRPCALSTNASAVHPRRTGGRPGPRPAGPAEPRQGDGLRFGGSRKHAFHAQRGLYALR
ncbi:hypothetical protein MTO96_029563 [Rhipicephalus appendiculatus]